MYLLDTDTLTAFFRGEGRVAERLLALPPAEIAIPAIAACEIGVGIARSAEPARRRGQWESLLSVVQVLPFGKAEAEVAAMIQAALLKAGTPIGQLDMLVAGTAMANDAVLVTRNVREFSRVAGLRTEDWY